MITNLEVYLWGTRIGILHSESYFPYIAFEYDKNFQNSNIELSPLMMPLSDKVYSFPFSLGAPFYNLPGLISQSLPDSFGRDIWNNYLLSQSSSLDDYSILDMLSYIGEEGNGALSYKPCISKKIKILEDVDVSSIAFLIDDILKDKTNVEFRDPKDKMYATLFKICFRCGGERPKAFVYYNEKTKQIKSVEKVGFDPYIIKFDNPSCNEDTLIEYTYYLMSKNALIVTSPSFLFCDKGSKHFMTKRIDRRDGHKLHMQSLSSLSHISNLESNVCSYEKVVEYMRKMRMGYKDIEQIYRRMVFNIFCVNQDDSVKNISFLMNKRGEWELSPFYDITFSPQEKGHQLSISHKTFNFNTTDLLLTGKRMGIKSKKCSQIIKEVGDAVKEFPRIARDVGITESTIEKIEKAMKDNVSAIWF